MNKKQEPFFVIWLGLLSLLSGIVNMTTLLIFATPSAHMTGNLSHFLLAIASGNLEQAVHLLVLIGCFCVGGICCGLIFSEKIFRLANRYGVLLMGISGILWLSDWYQWQSYWLYLLTFTVGLQNGLFIYYRGMIVRSSHFTGYLTDIGFALGRLFRGYSEEWEKIIFYLSSILCFLGGGLIAYSMMQYFFDRCMLVISGGYLITGIYYFLFRYLANWRKKHE